MSYHVDDTIAAIATAPGGAARGVVRISGPDAGACLGRVFVPRGAPPLEEVRVARVLEGHLRLPGIAADLPGQLYFWPNARSYTRAITAELHTLGSPPLLEKVLEAVCQGGVRLAEPGEFTLRAFLAGRLDLTQAEAVLGVIDAAGRKELDVALAQLAGGLAGPLGALRDELLDLLAHLEAGLDFVEEDLEFISAGQLDQQLCRATECVRRIVQQMESRTTTIGPARVVLVGWPNVGKSRLFNALAADADALVSGEPGTTRDYLTAEIDLGGIRCQLVDTAGVEPDASGGGAQAAAQQATQVQRAAAEVQLLCLDASRRLNPWELETLADASPASRILVLTKIDCPRATDLTAAALETSSHNGDGLDDLRVAIREAIMARDADTGVVGITAVRCRESLRSAAECLDRAVRLVGGGEELVAAEVRIALGELGKVVGAVYTDDLLDRIFSRFCIGK